MRYNSLFKQCLIVFIGSFALATMSSAAPLKPAAVPGQDPEQQDDLGRTAPSTVHSIGAGIILGEPTGLTLKFWRDHRTAFDVAAGWSTRNLFFTYGDYLWHFPGAFKSRDPVLTRITPYIGVGAFVAVTTADNTNAHDLFDRQGTRIGFGVRMPIGLEWRPGSPPIGVFMELAPSVGIQPGTYGFLSGGVGVRLFF